MRDFVTYKERLANPKPKSIRKAGILFGACIFLALSFIQLNPQLETKYVITACC